MSGTIESYEDGDCEFGDLSLADRKAVWDQKVDLYDWVAGQCAAGEARDMDDLICFFAYEDNPHEEECPCTAGTS